ncbi:Mannose 6-phosphate receptor-like protein 1 [Nakaseomyces bracarensis]|uniref:Autophagy-related protein 27 n=1 Tax=Nakaseomyces bracarensis TaxID=273131 RepID=A0ABR4NRC7_9SACH
MRTLWLWIALVRIVVGISEVDKNLFCAVMNPLTGSYIDLSQLSATPNDRPQSSYDRKFSDKSRWLVRDLEGSTNFTLSICSSAVTKDEKKQLENTTGAYYTVNDTKYQNNRRLVSIGDFSTRPHLVGGGGSTSESRTLTLKYENGSMCPNGIDRKATLLNFICDRSVNSKAQISYIGNLHECSYFFEIRSVYACPTSNKTNEVNVYGIFFSIIIIFFLVEFACRKWLFNKRPTETGNRTSRGLSDRGDDGTPGAIRLPEFSDLRWEMHNQGTSLWSRIPTALLTGLTTVQSLFKRNTRQRTTSYRDMEHQNDILDSLDNV